MRMKQIVLLLIFWGSAEAFAEIQLLLPKDGAVVPILSEAQKRYLGTPTGERVAGFDDPAVRARLALVGWNPAPVVFVWSGVDWDTVSAEIEIRRESDGQAVCRENISLRTRNV